MPARARSDSKIARREEVAPAMMTLAPGDDTGKKE
jgi:hypothetical protein